MTGWMWWFDLAVRAGLGFAAGAAWGISLSLRRRIERLEHAHVQLAAALVSGIAEENGVPLEEER